MFPSGIRVTYSLERVKYLSIFLFSCVMHHTEDAKLLVHAHMTTDEADFGEVPTCDESHGVVSDLSVNKHSWLKLLSRLKGARGTCGGGVVQKRS